MQHQPKQPPQRVPENAPGDFYVENNVCLRCCLPHIEAPGLMNDPNEPFEQCYFRRQPRTDAEMDQAVMAIAVSDIYGLRYGGNDPAILRRLHELRRGECCDHRLGDDAALTP